VRYPVTNQRQIRRMFWAENSELSHARPVRFGDERAHVADTRQAFVEFIDRLARDREISPALARSVSL
jgi:hypothetical protein